MKVTRSVCLVGRWTRTDLGLSAETESIGIRLPLYSLSINYQSMCLSRIYLGIWRSVTRRFRCFETVELFLEQKVLIVGINGLCGHNRLSVV